MLLPEASTLNLWMTVVSLFKIFAFVDLFVGPILLTFIACLYFCHPSPTEAMFETCAKHAGMLWQSWAINLFNSLYKMIFISQIDLKRNSLSF